MVQGRRLRSGPASVHEGQEQSDKSVQTSLRVSRWAYDYLKKAADRSGWSVGEEIRRRLEASFIYENRAVDSETYALVSAITTVVADLRVPFGSWHENRFSFEVFLEAVDALISLYRPAGEAVRPTGNEIAELYLGPAGTPQTAGRMLAGGAAAAANITAPGMPKPGMPKRVEPSPSARKR
jgi:hypothetical protein